MTRRITRLNPSAEELAPLFAANRARFGVAEVFPPEVLAAAEAAAREPALPTTDLTDVPFVTLDPPTSMDLDQAFHLERLGTGFRLRYAIADVAAFVGAGDPVDLEAHRRVETAYSPDGKASLHPPVLAEGAASLLPDAARPAAVWSIDVDDAGVTTAADVRRALVRSRAKLDYDSVQRQIDAGTADPMVMLLAEVGPILLEAQGARGGMSLNIPEQEVVERRGRYGLDFRQQLPCEEWNAQLSLLTGRAAAAIMLEAGVGILRTMPPADPQDVNRLRRVARGLGLDWPDSMGYPEFLATVNSMNSPAEAAFLDEATLLFRGSGYTVVDGEPPEVSEHSAIAAPYAHCTAPLRRLVDRYSNEVCLAAVSGEPVPEWVTAALPQLPEEMAEGTRRTAMLERANLDLVEAAVLEPYVGQGFRAAVVDLGKLDCEVAVPDQAVLARCDGRPELGSWVQVRLVTADPSRNLVRFALADPTRPPAPTPSTVR